MSYLINWLKKLIFFFIITLLFCTCSVFKSNKCDCPKWSMENRKNDVNSNSKSNVVFISKKH